MLKKLLSQKKYIFNKYTSNKGSAAIILSLMVSSSILATIYISQENIAWFTSSQDKSSENWQYNLTATMALGIGGYLVSNNFILCKQDGWGTNTPKCKWNANNGHRLVEFSKKDTSPSVITVENKKVLSFNGKIAAALIDDPGSTKDIEYKITFDLLNWKDSNINTFIGELPTSYCRHKTTKIIINGTCTTPNTQCEDTQDNTPTINPTDTICEYITSRDEDYFLVLMSVETLEGSTVKVKKYGAIRRPLAIPLIQIVETPKCELACPANLGSSLAECRGNFIPLQGAGTAKLKVKITNQGPGVLYSLALSKTTEFLDTEITASINKIITPDLIKLDNKKALFPGDYVEHESLIACADQINHYFRTHYLYGWGRSRNVNIDVHSHPFLKISYALGSFSDNGICILDGKSLPPSESECTPPATTCGKGATGVCRYINIEPKRSNILGDADIMINKEIKSITATTIIRITPPH